MKSKILNSLLIIASFLGYLEWSGNSHSFLIEAEFELFSKIFTNPTSTLHPFTVLPLVGQVLLTVTLFQKTPSKVLTYLGIASLGFLLVFMFFIGLMSLKYKIIISTIPFIVLSVIAIKHNRNIQ